MSLDIALTDKDDNEIVSMNWLRNPYGLCNWIEDNYQYTTEKPLQIHHVAEITNRQLWYVINNWAYDKAQDIDRQQFKTIVDQYVDTLMPIEIGYFFFDTSGFIQFVLPHWHLIPKCYILGTAYSNPKGIEVVGNTPDDTAHVGSRMGFNVEFFNARAFNLHRNNHSMLDQYKEWMQELKRFAELLQNTEYRFYCSN